MADLKFELVTPDRLVMSDDVYMVVVPGTEAESGILAGHAPYMTTLRDVGLFPWWVDPQLKLSFLRPLSSATRCASSVDDTASCTAD